MGRPRRQTIDYAQDRTVTITMSVAELQSSLHDSREHLFATIRGLTEEQFRHVPAGEEWCIAAHLAHLLRIERAFAERTRPALTEDTPFIESAGARNGDDPGLAQHLAVPQMIHGMLNARRDLTDVLAHCDDAALNRTVRHERLGIMTIADIARKMAEHEQEHEASIAKLVRQAPASGRVIIPLVRRS